MLSSGERQAQIGSLLPTRTDNADIGGGGGELPYTDQIPELREI